MVAPDCALVDAQLNDDGNLQEFRSQLGSARIIALSCTATPNEALLCIRAGVDGILSHDAAPEDVLETVKRACQGELPIPGTISATLLKQVASGQALEASHLARLTRREQQIATLVAGGFTDKAIASRLGLKVSTVKNHLHSTFRRLRIARRSELAALFWRELDRELGAGDGI